MLHVVDSDIFKAILNSGSSAEKLQRVIHPCRYNYSAADNGFVLF